MTAAAQIPDALAYLQAEHEAAWLASAFVAPSDMAGLVGARSVVVVGATGSGKSALRLALADHAQAAGHLLVEWHPTLDPFELGAVTPSRHWFGQLLDACLDALLKQLGQEPQRLDGVATWVRATLHWFIHTYLLDLAGDTELLLSRLTEELPPAGQQLLTELLKLTPAPIFRPGTPDSKLIVALADMLNRLGFAAVWLVIDDLEWLLEEDAARASDALRALLSTLGLFEAPRFAVKLLTPLAFEAAIMGSGGVARRRLDVYHLRWTEPQLLTIVERRIARLLGRESFQLGALYDLERLRERLDRYGGAVPRGWLEMIRPSAELYQRLGASRPLSPQEWETVWREHPPLLRFDLAENRAYLGYRELLDLAPGAQKLLRYLYQHRERLCSREELYYCALLELERPPTHGESGYASPKDWEGLFNTTLYRLRRAVEFDPDQPLYIVTRRGRGLFLEHSS